MPAVLSRSDDVVELEIEWSGDDHEYARWFTDYAIWADDLDKSKYSYSPPRILWFQDIAGTVTLVDCRTAGYTSNFRAGRGRIRPDRTVFGGETSDYAKINAMRSYIPGISQWLQLRSMKAEPLFENGRLQSLSVELAAPEPVKLHRRLNLCARPTFRFQPHASQDTSEIIERILLETDVSSARQWSDHEHMHLALRELISVAAWKQHNLTELSVQHAEDPDRVLSGTAVGPRWAPAVLNRLKKFPYDGAKDSKRFLFTFDDIGARGVGRWFQLREKYARGLNPILHTLGQRDVAVEIQVAQTGIGLDGVGYQLALDEGKSTNSANGERHKSRLLRVYRDVPVQMPFPEEPWATDAADAYNAVEHANHAMPSYETYVETRRMSQLLIRIWIANRLGMRGNALSTSIGRDPMAQPIQFS